MSVIIEENEAGNYRSLDLKNGVYRISIYEWNNLKVFFHDVGKNKVWIFFAIFQYFLVDLCFEIFMTFFWKLKSTKIYFPMVPDFLCPLLITFNGQKTRNKIID